MPLRKGPGKKKFSANVKELMATGRGQKQAVAIAYKEAGEKPKKRLKKLPKRR